MADSIRYEKFVVSARDSSDKYIVYSCCALQQPNTESRVVSSERAWSGTGDWDSVCNSQSARPRLLPGSDSESGTAVSKYSGPPADRPCRDSDGTVVRPTVSLSLTECPFVPPCRRCARVWASRPHWQPSTASSLSLSDWDSQPRVRESSTRGSSLSSTLRLQCQSR